MAILPCSVKHLGKRQVAWRRLETDEFLTIGKMVWSKDPRIVLEHKAHRADITSWDILLRNAKDEDAGYYECQVTSSEHLIWTLQLIVLEPVVTSKPKPRVHKQVTYSPLVTEKLHYNDERFLTQAEEFVTAGLPIRLACNTSLGNRTIPRSRLEWYKDGVNIQSNKHILLTRYQFETDRMYVSELLIDNARLSDSGLYLCRLKDHDLFVAKIYVLPDSKINGPKQERDDRSKIYGVDTLQQENHANRHVCSTTSLVVCFLFAILAAQQALLQGANHNERRGSIGRSWEGI
ncbi:zwei Ig domain protein zig-8 isoform X1 [Aplysia californica]|uniref:Zwei Ig domain protein zig-8 isoform X1 n=1 Tax=Aplysia californica TaxID=6500 RepID=A0ABM0ZVT1_APLCA|nr:zwei Ig domain protein zig-8 isoform X1 [Aplysia californica]